MIDLSTKNNRHRLVMFTNLAIIWGAHLAWRCEKKHCLMISCREGKKLVWILVRMNSKYYTWRLSNWGYPQIVQVMDDHDHDLVLKQPWSLGNSPLSENLHIISMNHSKQQHMAMCQHIPFVPERTDLQRNQFSPSGHKYVLHVCCICMYIIYTHNLHFHHQQLPFTFMYHTFPRT